MVSEEHFLRTLREQRLVAILRGRDRASTVAAGRTLVAAGIGCIEVSLSGADAFAAIEALAAAVGDSALIGAGTVIDAEDAARAQAAGAQFLVTPGATPAVSAAPGLGLPVLGGALTPTEIIAMSSSCAAVKLFPASLGGPEYLRAVRAPLPEIPLVPVGGIDVELAARYLAAGAIAVGVGEPLVGDACNGGDLSELESRARAFCAVIGRAITR